MRVVEIIADLHVEDIDKARQFDVDAAYEETQRCGYEIVYPLQDEPWGVRRFFVRAPDGNVLNIVRHRK